jgi:hypothetical protein
MFTRHITTATLTGVVIASLSINVGWSSGAVRTAFRSTVSAKLTGAAETPPVSSHASGNVVLRLDPKSRQVCWTFNVTGLRGALTANVLRAAPGKTGPPVVRLGHSYSPKGCIATSTTAINGIGNNPKAYYVNIQTRAFLNGAIRGQLH